MNCKKCGNPVSPDAAFCGVCGEKIEKEVTVVNAPAEKQSWAAFVLSIVGLSLCASGIVGLILSIIASSKAKKPNAALAKAAKILSIFGIIASAIFTLYWFIYVIIIVIGIILGAATA